MGEQAEIRRKAATRAVFTYAVLAFALVVAWGGLAVVAFHESRAREANRTELRLEYCLELEKLKTQNREEVAQKKRDYKRTLRLLKLEDTPEIRKAAEEGWARELARNAPRPCPYKP